MKKKVPKLKSDKEAEEFLDRDLTDYLNLKNFQRVSFEFQPKTKKISIRVSEDLLEAVKKKAKHQKISYQKYIRKAVEESLAPK